MADVDIDPFEEHESRPEDPTDEHIPLDPVTSGRSSTWDPRGDPGLAGPWELEHEQETSFGGISHTSVLHKEYLQSVSWSLAEFRHNKIV